MSSKISDIDAMQNITAQFYSEFCCMDISKADRGIHFVCSPERDTELMGYGRKYTLYIMVKDDLCIVAYSPKHREFIETLKNCSTVEIIEKVSRAFRLKIMQLMIFGGETVTDFGDAKILSVEDYPLYEAFFKVTNPDAKTDGWLREYFIEKAQKGYFTGYVKNGRLVSVCDAPDMPYLEGRIQHTGIETLAGERRQGYAKCTAALAAHGLIEKGICPQWECGIDNIASIGLARSIGYTKFGAAYILEE